MEPLYILDLEGTTGEYSTGIKGHHVNDRIVLRPGFKELIDYSNRGDIKIAIASRVPKHFLEEIRNNLKIRGINMNCRIYTKEDVELKDKKLIHYKDYQKIYEDHNLFDPSAQSAVIGDFLRFNEDSYNQQFYRNWDFKSFPSPLVNNYSLNDHPFSKEGNTPVYVVLPRIWMSKEGDGSGNLDFEYVISFLNQLYRMGNEDFRLGLDLFSAEIKDNQHVRYDGLSRKLLKNTHTQDYLIMKGRKENWKPCLEVM